MASSIDVLVVGAGPTGSVLAIDLIRRGLKVRVIEKQDRSFPGSRAKGLQPRTLEMLDDLGVINPVLASGSLYPSLGVHLGPFILPKRMYKMKAASADIPYPNTWLIPQFRTDAILHERLSESGVSVEFNSTLRTFEQDEGGVNATVEGPSGSERIRSKYLVGADGGGSAVRQALEIDFPGTTVESDRMILVDCKVDGLSRKYWHAWPGRKGRFTVACPLPGTELFQWMIRLQPGEEPRLDEAAINERVHRKVRSGKVRLHDITWISVFRPNIRLADHYRKGRVFIAGDAAHVHTPMGAQGLNTGVQDAYNLGWKLGQVIHGAPEALLETYEAERQPIAATVLGRSTRKYEATEKYDAESFKRGKDEQQLLITYRAGPLGRRGGDSTAKLQVGDRAPDAKLKQADGSSISLFELLRGPHFTAIAYGDVAAQELGKIDWPDKGASLKRVLIGTEATAGASDHIVSDSADSFKKAYGIGSDTVVLIRPDGYIGQIATSGHVQRIDQAMRSFTPRFQETLSGAQ